MNNMEMTPQEANRGSINTNEHDNGNKLPFLLQLLCFVQIALIFIIGLIAVCNHLKHKSFQKTVKEDLSEYVEQYANNHSIVDTVYLTPADYARIWHDTYDDAFKYMANEMVGLESQINESNSFTSILLTLITLCISLSVIIPYILSESSIGERVQRGIRILKKHFDNQLKQYQDDIKATTDEKYKETMDTCIKNLEYLKWSEGHTSRMVGYILLNKNTKIERAKEISWSIGWSAKAMIRYIELAGQKRYDAQKFFDNCQQYICDSKPQIKSLKLDPDENVRKKQDIESKVLRAFIDLFDVFQLYEHSKGTLRMTKKTELLTTLQLLYIKLSEFEDYGYDYREKVRDALENKSKHNQHHPGEVHYINKAHDWLKENYICDDDWKPIPIHS